MSESRHILVVDDEEDVRDTLHNVLKSMNYVPYVASGGAEALEIIKNNKIDVIIILCFIFFLRNKNLTNRPFRWAFLCIK